MYLQPNKNEYACLKFGNILGGHRQWADSVLEVWKQQYSEISLNAKNSYVVYVLYRQYHLGKRRVTTAQLQRH